MIMPLCTSPELHKRLSVSASSSSYSQFSPDLAPSDYYLFRNLKSRLRGTRFRDDDDCVCVEVLRPIQPSGSCRARSVYLTTRLLGRLGPLSG